MTTASPHDDPAKAFSLADLEYDVPPELIAQTPSQRRQDARLLVLDRGADRLTDGGIVDLPGLLRPGDLLVLNDTQVLPAKFTARRATGGALVGLFLAEESSGVWRVLLRGARRVRVGETLTLAGLTGASVHLELTENCGQGEWCGRVSPAGSPKELLARVGETPLPPYIRREQPDPETADADRTRYQTVFARTPGAVAAPTAGLHLTDELLHTVQAAGVELAYVTLHVGIGTFKPLRTPELDKHVMHTERYQLPKETCEAVKACRARGGRVVAVGTTSVRVLESAAKFDPERTVEPRSGTTGLFIYPPYRFGVTDALLTNFHWPESTLLALVMALAGIERIKRAYRHAIAQRYRLFSFGDAMFIC